ncbi:MAG: hypothetical protein MjAS7_2134 [Metallosphaera javensis (ex Sakai et al. 2022)]|nr:MAG: hypothetical protein MjAS7_2134 [Metallosphaera javensis (ex Sakai et al. 2022)]
MVSPVNSNESLRDRLVRFKRATKVDRGLEMIRYSVSLFCERGLAQNLYLNDNIMDTLTNRTITFYTNPLIYHYEIRRDLP